MLSCRSASTGTVYCNLAAVNKKYHGSTSMFLKEDSLSETQHPGNLQVVLFFFLQKYTAHWSLLFLRIHWWSIYLHVTVLVWGFLFPLVFANKMCSKCWTSLRPLTQPRKQDKPRGDSLLNGTGGSNSCHYSHDKLPMHLNYVLVLCYTSSQLTVKLHGVFWVL